MDIGVMVFIWVGKVCFGFVSVGLQVLSSEFLRRFTKVIPE